MTDKVQKIREEVERLMYGFNLEADIASCEDTETEKLADTKYQLCKKILDYIDKVQEEPVNEQNLSNVQRTVKDWKEEPVSECTIVPKPLECYSSCKECPYSTKFVSEGLDETAEAHSLLVPSVLYPLLDKEKQELWKKEIEDAFKAGAQ